MQQLSRFNALIQKYYRISLNNIFFFQQLLSICFRLYNYMHFTTYSRIQTFIFAIGTDLRHLFGRNWNLHDTKFVLNILLDKLHENCIFIFYLPWPGIPDDGGMMMRQNRDVRTGYYDSDKVLFVCLFCTRNAHICDPIKACYPSYAGSN